MQVRALGPNKAARAEAETLLNGLERMQERALLRLMREEATTIVLQVRVWIEERRAAAKLDEDDAEDIVARLRGESDGLSV